jgi:hypothetical protein
VHERIMAMVDQYFPQYIPHRTVENEGAAPSVDVRVRPD